MTVQGAPQPRHELRSAGGLRSNIHEYSDYISNIPNRDNRSSGRARRKNAAAPTQEAKRLSRSPSTTSSSASPRWERCMPVFLGVPSFLDLAILGRAWSAVSGDGPTGIWRSEGYGMVWEINAEGLQIWEVTATTCVRPARLANGPPPPGAAAAFFEDRVTAWIIRPGWTSQRLWAHSPGTVSDVAFNRVPRLPELCLPAKPHSIENA